MNSEETILDARPVTAERFAPFGDVIQATAAARAAMNEARFERFDDLARVDISAETGGQVGVSIARCRTATKLPYRFDMVERHPLGSQAFVPLARFSFLVVVGPADETVQAADLRAFLFAPGQGVNYHRGVWHMPLIALENGQEFLVIDRAGNGRNCEELVLGEAVTLQAIP
jgi:ureidoglycolate lyase